MSTEQAGSGKETYRDRFQRTGLLAGTDASFVSAFLGDKAWVGSNAGVQVIDLEGGPSHSLDDQVSETGDPFGRSLPLYVTQDGREIFDTPESDALLQRMLDSIGQELRTLGA